VAIVWQGSAFLKYLQYDFKKNILFLKIQIVNLLF
jgi:hypothetical protein